VRRARKHEVPPRRLDAGIRRTGPWTTVNDRPRDAIRGTPRGFAINRTLIIMAPKQDVDMADSPPKPQDPNDYADLLQTNYTDAFAFTETEKLALGLYDQLREVELQQSLLHAHRDGTYVSTCALPWVLSNLL
jgi:hypothetical protein